MGKLSRADEDRILAQAQEINDRRKAQKREQGWVQGDYLPDETPLDLPGLSRTCHWRLDDYRLITLGDLRYFLEVTNPDLLQEEAMRSKGWSTHDLDDLSPARRERWVRVAKGMIPVTHHARLVCHKEVQDRAEARRAEQNARADRFIELRKERRLSFRMIGEMHGISAGRVQQLVRDREHRREVEKFTFEERVWRTLRAGRSWSDVATEFGVNEYRISQIRRRFDAVERGEMCCYSFEEVQAMPDNAPLTVLSKNMRISVRVKNCLKNSDWTTIGELRYKPDYMLHLPGLGYSGIDEIRAYVPQVR